MGLLDVRFGGGQETKDVYCTKILNVLCVSSSSKINIYFSLLALFVLFFDFLFFICFIKIQLNYNLGRIEIMLLSLRLLTLKIISYNNGNNRLCMMFRFQFYTLFFSQKLK